MSDDSDNGSKVKLIIILVVVVAIAGLVIAGALTSKSPTPAPVAQAPAPTPAPAQTAQVTSVQTSDAIQPILNNKLPFAISAKHSADLEVQGAALVRGKVEMPKGESGNIDRLANTDNQSWVIMPMQANHKRSLLGQSVATAQRVLIPTLAVDGAGFIEPVGFAYQDATKRIVQLEPEFGLRGMSQTPELLAARDDQQLWLIYRVPSGSYINQMVMGKQVVTVWSPPLQVK